MVGFVNQQLGGDSQQLLAWHQSCHPRGANRSQSTRFENMGEDAAVTEVAAGRSGCG